MTTVQSVDRAMKLVMLLASGPMRLSDLSKGIGIGLPGTLKLLRAMQEYDLVTQQDDGRYFLGVGCCNLARSYLQRNDIVNVAREEMCRLSQRIGNRVILACLKGLDQVNLLCVDIPMGIPIDEMPLKVGPAWRQATGQVLLAFSDTVRVKNHLKKHPLQAGVCGIRSEGQFERLLTDIRRKGWADLKADESALHYVAAPIRNISGDVIAAVGAHLGGVVLEEENIRTVIKAAETVSRLLGYKKDEQ